MVKNYYTPELEVISIYSEGMLASSIFGGESSGSNIIFDGDEENFESLFNE